MKRPTEADHGAIVWPLWKAFLDSDLDLKQWAEAAGVKPGQIERAFLNPGGMRPDLIGALAYGLGVRVTFRLDERPDAREARKAPQ